MSKYKEILDSINWSFSSINAYDECPYMFYLTYIKKFPRSQNAFAQWGTFCHKLIEKYYKHELELFDLSDEYHNDYDKNINLEFPACKYSDLSISYKEAGQKYFDEFEDNFINCKVADVEKYFETKIGNYKFIGVIDLILKDGEEFYICDHKSKNGFKSDSEKRHYLFQLYLYSKYIYETYGKYPTKLIYNMFRKRDIITEPFNYKEYLKALSWAESIINQAYEDEDFFDKIEIKRLSSRKKVVDEFKRNDFFCNELCSVRHNCEKSIFLIN